MTNAIYFITLYTVTQLFSQIMAGNFKHVNGA